MNVQVLEPQKGRQLRQEFVRKFIDTSTIYYKKYIALKQDAEGQYYDGYLWDYLAGNENGEWECTMAAAMNYLMTKDQVFVMWDLFSGRRIGDRWTLSKRYPKDSVFAIPAKELCQELRSEWDADRRKVEMLLPEDLYVFDTHMNWYVIFTHEEWDVDDDTGTDDDDYDRVCFMRP